MFIFVSLSLVDTTNDNFINAQTERLCVDSGVCVSDSVWQRVREMVCNATRQTQLRHTRCSCGGNNEMNSNQLRLRFSRSSGSSDRLALLSLLMPLHLLCYTSYTTPYNNNHTNPIEQRPQLSDHNNNRITLKTIHRLSDGLVTMCSRINNNNNAIPTYIHKIPDHELHLMFLSRSKLNTKLCACFFLLLCCFSSHLCFSRAL